MPAWLITLLEQNAGVILSTITSAITDIVSWFKAKPAPTPADLEAISKLEKALESLK